MELQYERNDINFIRNKFRVRGDVVEIFPSYCAATPPSAWNFSAMRSTASARSMLLTGEVKAVVDHVAIYPASHYIVPPEKMDSGHLAN